MQERGKHSDELTQQKPLRLWPGVVAVVLQWLGMFGVPIVVPEVTIVGVIGGVFGTLAVVVWWAFLSRAPRVERWGAVVMVVIALFATPRLLHESVATGNSGLQFFIYAIPMLSLAFVVWAVASRRLADGPRRAAMVATILLACGVLTIVRSDGVTGDGAAEFAWRWGGTAEERLLAQAGDELMRLPSDPVGMETEADWPGLRGPHRNGIIPGVRIETDWTHSPPVELWRRPIGPGVSSFAVQGDDLYTQEQRGDDEVVAAYNMTTGEPVWRHRDMTRFWDSHVGAGPRATPALSGGQVYSFGSTGILNALDADDGAVVWSRNAASDTDAKLPYWGFVGSPLVVDDTVIVAVAGQLAAYDAATGQPRWFRPDGGEGYSSPHLSTFDGVAQADGTLLWEHPWPGIGIVQPAQTGEGDVLISMISAGAVPIGTRRIGIVHRSGVWTVEEHLTSNGLKPSFSAFVVHKGHAFGFDGRFLACIDVEDGKRKWKGGRYGSGQLVLLPDQDLLLVVSERGELALVGAAPDQFTELARFPAIEGKTWNHPVLVGDVLLLRNGQEMVAFRLSLAGGRRELSSRPST